MRARLIVGILVAARVLAAAPLVCAHRHIERSLPQCADPHKGCVRVKLDYVEVTSGPAPVRSRMNAAILAYLERGDETKLTPEQFANDFIKTHRREPHNVPSDGRELSRTVKLLRATPPVFAFVCDTFAYEGGAHPSSDTRFLNFDARTGEPVTLASILKENALPRLAITAEVYFRKARQLTATADLAEEGFRFAGNQFKLNDTYGIGERELIFFFNDYEIGPHSMGTTEVKIPYGAIVDLLRPGIVSQKENGSK